jgi:predicted chitinase
MVLPLSHQQIADAIDCPLENVSLYWPLIDTCLDALNCGSVPSKIAALATIAVETANTFKPIHEYGSDVLHEKEYGGRKDLGNLHAGDGAKFAGRGFIQITGEVNYADYGKRLGIDMLSNPDWALDPNASAAIFAAYWHDRKCDVYADSAQWETVRKRVNGGINGLPKFMRYVADLRDKAFDYPVADVTGELSM